MSSVILRCLTLYTLFFSFSLVLFSQSRNEFSFDSLNASEKKINLYLIPIGTTIDRAKVGDFGIVFKKAKLNVNCSVLPEFNVSEKNKWNNPFPDHKQFTKQMKRVRTNYFDRFQKDPNSIYFFVIPQPPYLTLQKSRKKLIFSLLQFEASGHNTIKLI